MTQRITFRVIGVAQPKGSTKTFVPKSWANRAHAAGRSPRAIVTSANPRLKEWQTLIATEAARTGAYFDGPVIVTLRCALPRPKSLPRRVTHHTKKPDVDKLIRAVNDALTGILYRDDSQIVQLMASKCYAR